MVRALVACLLLGAALVPASAAAQAPAPATAAEHLRALQAATDASGGTRAAGSRGDAAARAYVAQRLTAAGWTVAEQPFAFPAMRERTPSRLRSGSAEYYLALVIGSGRGTVRARTVEVGARGCRGADWRRARGRIAVVADGGCALRRKVRLAQQGRAGAVVVSIEAGVRRVLPSRARIPVLLTDTASAGALARRGRGLVAVDAVPVRARTANVVATRPGTGSTISAGAHLDTVAEGPGANDNGSGVAALLAVADRLPSLPRPVTLGFWGAEELGLIGSRRYVSGLEPAQREAIGAYVNLDMVGTSGGRLEVSASADALGDLLAESMRDAGLRPALSRELDSGSDQSSFAAGGIASGFLFTGLDACYHRRCDTAGKVDAAQMQRVSDGVLDALGRLAAG